MSFGWPVGQQFGRHGGCNDATSQACGPPTTLMTMPSGAELYSFWIVRVEDVLAMKTLKPHQQLLGEGKLVRWTPEIKSPVAFVSHQWLGWGHPDPEQQHLSLLKRTLRRARSDKHRGTIVDNELDLFRYCMGGNGAESVLNGVEAKLPSSSSSSTTPSSASAPLSGSKRRRRSSGQSTSSTSNSSTSNCASNNKMGREEDVSFGEEGVQEWAHSGYIWYDYFCCPQDVTGLPDHREEFLRCACSMPFYIQRCKFFIVVAPPLTHADMTLPSGEKMSCDLRSWSKRGWCRVEILLRLIYWPSGDGIFALQHSSTLACLAPSITWNLPVASGSFSCCQRNHVIPHMWVAFPAPLLCLPVLILVLITTKSNSLVTATPTSDANTGLTVNVPVLCDKNVAMQVVEIALRERLASINEAFTLQRDSLSPRSRHRMRCTIAAAGFASLGLSSTTQVQEQVLERKGYPSRRDCTDEQLLAHFYQTFFFTPGEQEACAFGFS